MTSQRNEIPDPDRYEWEFENRDGVGIWFMNGWQGFADETLEAASQHYRERGKQSDIEATVAVFGDETSLPKETQEYMGEEWSANGAYTGVERVGFVSDGITAMAVKSRMDIDGAEVESFDDLEAALEWARGA
ncbi:hypothetical protein CHINAEXTREME_01430 [Halobiforma lacisalsi AJ5]|uniref:STAS/SEC14 domain-containing protein n=1 Tax=Natronobacterium lacisalsi AJ5 TaxID=358396 RepID=M0LJN0_NATLA|nr:hypothetical protein [Halobiforma lacisalsi]APW96508.1 hypothetical protein CHINAEXTREME_01430 [Halobiforma lacisalsi AJ5]EMA32215.1 hypothetical protein C445_12911 [Halobiforma lacisalsi AJ5]